MASNIVIGLSIPKFRNRRRDEGEALPHHQGPLYALSSSLPPENKFQIYHRYHAVKDIDYTYFHLSNQ